MNDMIQQLIKRYPSLTDCSPAVEQAQAILTECYRTGGKLLVCGNGGSASDALHIVGELMKGFVLPRTVGGEARECLLQCGGEDASYLTANLQGALPAIALGNESALSTAYANDVAPDLAFAQQTWGLGRAGDVLLGISTSGNSRNVLLAAKAARARGMKVLGLTGMGGGKLATLCDACIAVPERETYRVQELHLPIYHALCLALERTFFGGAQ